MGLRYVAYAIWVNLINLASRRIMVWIWVIIAHGEEELETEALGPNGDENESSSTTSLPTEDHNIRRGGMGSTTRFVTP